MAAVFSPNARRPHKSTHNYVGLRAAPGFGGSQAAPPFAPGTGKKTPRIRKAGQSPTVLEAIVNLRSY